MRSALSGPATMAQRLGNAEEKEPEGKEGKMSSFLALVEQEGFLEAEQGSESAR